MENLLKSVENGTLVLTINREKQLNALNKQTIDELSVALDEAREDASIRSIVITGAGEKAFVAGADIKEFASFNIEEGKMLAAEGQAKLFDKVERMNKPVVAAVNGFALGGGLELAMSAHMRIASDNARMGLPEVSLGVIPGYGGTQRLAHLVGKGKAMELITTAGMMKANDALQWGLVNHVVSQEELMGKALEIA
ncbi:MAG: enoyl-CoA hydratase/isomerase family protein, partial [Flavobacteriales bacterium]|nr:enoyl-CoA hydratase/isomerase family protein [Flavobacteriales bacterium]